MSRQLTGFVCLLLVVAGILFPLTNAVAGSSSPVVDLADVPLLRLDGDLFILRDPSARLSIADVASGVPRDDFRPARPADLAPGYTGDAIWVRVTLRNPSRAPLLRYLEIGPPRLRDIRVYDAVDGRYRERRAGLAVPVSERLVLSRQAVFPVEVAAGAVTTLYVRIASGNAIMVSARLWQPAHFFGDERLNDLVNGIQFGAIFLFALYSLLLFFTTRDEAFLYFCIAMAGYGFYDVGILQYGYEFFWPYSPDWSQRCPGVFLAVTIAASTRLISRLLQLPSRLPLMAAVMSGVAWMALILVPALLFLPYGRVVPVINLLALVTVLLSLAMTVRSVVVGERNAWLLLLAFIMFWFTSMLRLSQIFGFLPHDLWVDYSQSWSMVLSGAIMAVVLADNVRQFRAGREQAQADMLAEREASAARLERQVRERTIELLQAKEQAEEASRAKSTFLAHMSHELRTPLHSILGYSRLALESDLEVADRRRIESVQRSGTHLLALIDEVLDYARGEAGRLQLEPRPVYLGALLESAVEDVLPLARAEGVDLHAVLDPSLPPVVMADAGRLRQVLGNLLGNACRHSQGSRVTLDVKVLPESGLVGQVSLWLAVRDNGVGIPLSARERIFSPFEQVAATATSRGVGLGLPIAHQLVQLMGGGLVCECPPEGGSLFHFRICLPLASEADLAPVHVPLSFHRYKGPVRRILVVDDIAENRALLADILASAGFDLALAASGFAALELLQHESFDAVVADQFMPGLSGWQVLRRAREAGCVVPFLLLSATRPMPPVDWPRHLVFAASLMKPIDPAALIRVVGEVLSLDRDDEGHSGDGALASAQPLSCKPSAETLARLRMAVDMGQVTDIEEWVEQVLLLHPESAAFACDVREAVRRLDFARIRALMEA